MKNKPDRDKAADTSKPKRVLRKIPTGAVDTKLEEASDSTPEVLPNPEPVQGLAGLHRTESKDNASPPAESSSGRYGAPIPNADADKLPLPEGGLVALRRSGGIRFTSRSVTVYVNGQVATGGDTTPISTKHAPARKLDDEELAHLYRALEQANFEHLPATSGKQNPDGYAYEIAARIGPANYTIEVFDGSIPSRLAPLIQLLTGYMRLPS